MRKGYYYSNRRSAHHQKGVALITSLIITTVAVSVATLLIYRQQIQIRLSSNISTLEQNYQYAYGMEDFAGTILKSNLEDQPDFVSLNDDWYSETGLVLPITGGTMTGKLYDLQARINLNSLNRPIIEIPAPPPVTDPITPPTTIDIASVTKARITELVRIIDEEQAMGPPENFAIIVKDWIDSDQENGNSIVPGFNNDRGNGAETNYYQSLETAYYSANTEMISPTEIRLLKNMKEALYKKITDNISTLPTEFGNQPLNTPINVNTASESVLKTLGFDPDTVGQIIDIRKDTPYESRDTFLNSPEVRPFIQTENNPTADVDPLDIDVTSQYFLLEGKVEINDTRLFVNSILWRKQDGTVSVIMRDFSNPQTISKVVN